MPILNLLKNFNNEGFDLCIPVTSNTSFLILLPMPFDISILISCSILWCDKNHKFFIGA